MRSAVRKMGRMGDSIQDEHQNAKFKMQNAKLKAGRKFVLKSNGRFASKTSNNPRQQLVRRSCATCAISENQSQDNTSLFLPNPSWLWRALCVHHGRAAAESPAPAWDRALVAALSLLFFSVLRVKAA